MKTTLIIPTLDEIDGMKAIMPRIDKKWVDEILVVDGGSTDGTIEYAKENKYILFEPKVKGIVNQLKESFKIAKGDIIILFSPDGNSIPELIPNLVEKMKEGHDMVIVSRYAKGAKSYDDDFLTKIGNKIFTKLVNSLFKANYTDVLVIFRAFRKDILDKLGNNISGDIDMHLSIGCAKKKLKVADIPGNEPKRISGERKMKVIKTTKLLIRQIIREKFNK